VHFGQDLRNAQHRHTASGFCPDWCILHCRPDLKNARYQQTLKQGDLLLGRLQKLSKVVDIE